jgi:thymidine phosphorylase
MEKFREMVAAQGGDLDAPRPIAPASELTATHAGCVAAIDAEKLGMALIEMGAGRKKLGDKIDFATGLEMLVRLGESVERGQPIVRVFARSPNAEIGRQMIAEAITISNQPYSAPRLIVERIEASS